MLRKPKRKKNTNYEETTIRKKYRAAFVIHSRWSQNTLEKNANQQSRLSSAWEKRAMFCLWMNFTETETIFTHRFFSEDDLKCGCGQVEIIIDSIIELWPNEYTSI